MKNIELTAYEGNDQDMNDLVDTICKVKELDIDLTRDKYKMLTNVTRTHLLTFCEKNNVNINFNFTGKKKDVTVFLKVKDVVWQHIQEDNGMTPTEKVKEKVDIPEVKEEIVLPEAEKKSPVMEDTSDFIPVKEKNEGEEEDKVFGGNDDVSGEDLF